MKRNPGAAAGTPRCEDAHRRDPATCIGDGVAVAHFRDVAGHDPWPWQRRLLARLVGGDVPPTIDIPTGCGKTAGVLLALLARLANPDLPGESCTSWTGARSSTRRLRPFGCGSSAWRRFDPGRDHTLSREAAYLVATAAGKVGVDLDADHAIADLTTLDAMIQRFGRINRTGAGEATITVVCAEGEAEAQPSQPGTFAERRDAARQRTLEVLRGLPEASPATLDAIDANTVAACTVSRVEPARLDAVAVEAFAATSARLPLPPVGVHLRGVDEGPEVPETHLAWRWDIPKLVRLGPGAVRAALAFHRPQPSELARVPTPFARRLITRALARRDTRGLALVVMLPTIAWPPTPIVVASQILPNSSRISGWCLPR